MWNMAIRRALVAGIIVAGLLTLLPGAARAEAPRSRGGGNVEERLRALEAEIQQLRRERDEARKAATPEQEPLDKPAVAAIVDDKLKQQKMLAGWQDGFFLQSPSGDFKFKLRGYLQTDYRFFPLDDGDTGTDSFFLRRARPIFEGTLYKYFDFRFMPDFGGGSTVLQDGYMDVRYLPYASLRAGKFKEPFSLERLQSGADLLFIERAISQNLAPNRDVGVQLYGDVSDSLFSYQLGIFNGLFDGASSDGDLQTDKDFAGRFFVQPFRGTDLEPAKGFGFGLAGTYGQRTGEPESALAYKTAGRSNFYRYVAAANVTGKGKQWRIAPQAYYYWGPFGFMGEYIVSHSHIKGTLGTAPDITREEADESNKGFFVQASWVLTGENASYKGVAPINNFDPFNGRWGAFEIAGRVSNVSLDDEALDAKLASGTDDAWAYTAGVNWYLNRAFKIQFNYERTDFGLPEPRFGSDSRDHEDVLITRFQIAY